MNLLHFHAMYTAVFLVSALFTLISSSSGLPFFINCGSSDNITVNERTFIGDVHIKEFHLSAHGESIVENNSIPSKSSWCQAARVFTKTSSYVFDIPPNVFYILRFHFCQFSQLADAKFNVSVNGNLLLQGFSASDSSADDKEFFVTVNSNSGKLRVYFHPGSSKAFINALEVLSTEQNITEETGPWITDSGLRSNTRYKGPRYKVLETIYRINVGGLDYIDKYWKTWIADDKFLIDKDSAKNCLPYSRGVTYGEPGAATTDDAGEDTYETAKELKGLSLHTRATWQFNVSKSSTFFVRVHFCDITDFQLGPYSFNFYINKYKQLLQPSAMFSSKAVPFYKDYMVDSGYAEALNISIETVDHYNLTYGFLNGVEIMQVKNGTAPDHNNSSHVVVLVACLLSAGLVLVIILVVVIFLCRKKRKTKPVEADTFQWGMVSLHQETSSRLNLNTLDRSSSNPSTLPNLHLRLKIPFVEIQQVTRNFDPALIIGEGGFGKVYKGTLKNGRKVAVKRSNPDHGQGLPEFHTEIMVLSNIRHRHLVSLIGYCNEEGEMILVYEFMEKGTLRDHLYGSTKSSGLTWKKRLEICIGAAKGLDYLHTGSDRGIIHRDVKSTNILLDENFVAKVADFGLSRPGQLDQTPVSTDVKGTFGYLDPEYFQWMQLTEKSDVYSFGVVLLEVISARQVINVSLPKEQVNLVDWAMTCYEQGQIEKIIDPCIAGEINQNSLKKFVETAEKCLKDNAVERPTMSDVRWDLEYSLQLQKTATQEGDILQDDSMADASFNIPLPVVQRLPSQSLTNQEEEDALLMDSTTREVFSQLAFDDGR